MSGQTLSTAGCVVTGALLALAGMAMIGVAYATKALLQSRLQLQALQLQHRLGAIAIQRELTTAEVSLADRTSAIAVSGRIRGRRSQSPRPRRLPTKGTPRQMVHVHAHIPVQRPRTSEHNAVLDLVFGRVQAQAPPDGHAPTHHAGSTGSETLDLTDDVVQVDDAVNDLWWERL